MTGPDCEHTKTADSPTEGQWHAAEKENAAELREVAALAQRLPALVVLRDSVVRTRTPSAALTVLPERP